jgi:hypothetical protein
MGLLFSDRDKLLVAIKSGHLPVDVLTSKGKVGHVGNNIVISTDKSISTAQKNKLKVLGITEYNQPNNSVDIDSWLEAVSLDKVTVSETPAMVLFTMKVNKLINGAAELLRLGCDRQEYMISGDMAMIRAVDPPTYTVVRAIDHEDDITAFVPSRPGQEYRWIEVGYTHPLEDRIDTVKGKILLISNNGWFQFVEDKWLPLDSALNLVVTGGNHAVKQGKLPPRRQINLRLTAGRRESPSLWVIRENAVAVVDKLLSYLPDTIMERLTFAVTNHSNPTVILRARSNRNAPPDLSLQAEEYAQLYQMPDIYSPAGSVVEPPLRRERLRQILGINTNEVMWLAPHEGGFKVERMDDGAFAPLSDWVDYIVHSNADKFNSWARSSAFDYFPFVSTGVEWASKNVASNNNDDDNDGPRKPRRARVDRDAPSSPSHTPVKTASTEKKAKEPAKVIQFDASENKSVVDQELVKLETEFMALDVPADHPDRMELFGKLGSCYARLERKHEAGLCYSRSVWEADGESSKVQLNSWLNLDLRGVSRNTALTKALKQNTPSIDSVRTVAILAAAADDCVADDPHTVTRWLDNYDSILDTRTIWLARLGLSQAVGGDVLGLTKARDRILHGLLGGLSIEKELPTFLRIGARTGALGNSSSEQLSKTLKSMLSTFLETKRKRTEVEAAPNMTNTYIKLIVANGLAKIGSHKEARELVAQANNDATPFISDSLHSYLISSFGTRVEQAIAGLASDTPLGPDLIAQLNKMERVRRYKADRFREVSMILEPTEKPEGIKAFSRHIADIRGAEITELQNIDDINERIAGMKKLVDNIDKDSEDPRRIIDGLLDLTVQLPAFNASQMLTKLIPAVLFVSSEQRALLYAKTAVVAGHFNMSDVINQILGHLTKALGEVNSGDIEKVLQFSLKALRRVGLRSEINDLLQKVNAKLGDDTDSMRGRLALAAGISYLGDFAKVEHVYNSAKATLNTGTLTLPNRLNLTRSLALAYSHAPLDKAISGITEMLDQYKSITDGFGTNSHFCLSVVSFVESLVLGITSDDLIIGESGRRFVEDDEHLIRRRLHKDIA